MLWGSFGIVHIASLLIGALILVGLYFLLKRRTQKTQVIVLGILSFSGIAAMIFNLLEWGSPWEYLPLHLCSLTAMVLPIAVFTRNKALNNLLLLWSLGAVMALVVNTAQANFEIFSKTFGFYFFPHLLEFGIPIIMFKLGLAKKDPKCILSTILITLGMVVAVHLANVGLNSYFIANNITNPSGAVVQVNYMYTIVPENPLLALFRSIIDADFWYMMLTLPIIVIYLAAVYAPQLIAAIRKKKEEKAA